MFQHVFKQMMDYPPSEVKLDQKMATSLLKKSSFILVSTQVNLSIISTSLKQRKDVNLSRIQTDRLT